jgi:hypothetical protein
VPGVVDDVVVEDEAVVADPAAVVVEVRLPGVGSVTPCS